MKAEADNMPVAQLRGIAFFNTERDATIQSLSSFDAAVGAIVPLPNFRGRFGSEAGTRIVLQFAYQYFSRVGRIEWQEAAFESLWCDLLGELADSFWLMRGVANIRNFDCDRQLLELGAGISIRGRSQADLRSLGFNDAIWERIEEDWSGIGASSFVLVAEHSFPKVPTNLTLSDSYELSVKAIRAIWTLRLADAGSISIGPMWVVRGDRFNVGLGGLQSVGASIPASGRRYRWSDNVAQMYPSIYSALAKLETDGYARSPGSLEVALRAFMATYDRWPAFPTYQVIDAIMAFEALLGTETEISFRLSFRVAAILAATDEERGALLKLLRDFYDTRSRIVHGAEIKGKQRNLLQRIDELRDLARKLLRALVVFAAGRAEGYDKTFWRERLDASLLNAVEREKLRHALGLSS